jgi:hypothetical protein
MPWVNHTLYVEEKLLGLPSTLSNNCVMKLKLTLGVLYASFYGFGCRIGHTHLDWLHARLVSSFTQALIDCQQLLINVGWGIPTNIKCGKTRMTCIVRSQHAVEVDKKK